MGTILEQSHPLALTQAVACIQSGGLIVLPTDTVYGLGCSLFNPESISKLYDLKGRDTAKAIAVMLAEPGQIASVAGQFSSQTVRLAETFWPGAITLVVNKHPSIPAVLSTLPTVGLRIPDYPFVQELIRQTGPMAVTSANLAGQPSATNLPEVLEQLGDQIDLYIDGGNAPGGLSSTVVDCTGDQPVILRAGPIGLEQILATWNK